MRRKLYNSRKRKFLLSLKNKIQHTRDVKKRERFIPPNGQTIVNLKQTVVELQSQLAVAIRCRDERLVSSVTQRILRSKLCQSYAVYRTISSKGARSLGITEKNRPFTNEHYELLRQEVWKAVKNPQSYKATPLKRIYIPKPNSSELRPLSVPTYVDRALQHLFLLPLQVFQEEFSERHSFGFRPFRSPGWAAKAVTLQIWSRKSYGPPHFAIELDIRKCFDKISHSYMKEHISSQIVGDTKVEVIPKPILNQWLQSGYIDVEGAVHPKNQVLPTDEGIPQGGPISPTIANMVLNGVEKVAQNAVLELYPDRGSPEAKASNFWINPEFRILWKFQGEPVFCTFGLNRDNHTIVNGSFRNLGHGDLLKQYKASSMKFFTTSTSNTIGPFSFEIISEPDNSTRNLKFLQYCSAFRFADDNVVLVNTKEAVEAVLAKIRLFLSERGLELNMAKTYIRNLENGDRFRFVGFEFAIVQPKSGGYKVYCFPPSDKIAKVKEAVNTAFLKYRRQPYSAFFVVNSIVRGWCNFYSCGNSSRAFQGLSKWLWHRTWKYLWVFHKYKSEYRIRSQRQAKKAMGYSIYKNFRFPHPQSPSGARWWGIPNEYNTSVRWHDKGFAPYMLIDPKRIKVSTPSILTGMSAFYPDERLRLIDKSIYWKRGLRQKLLKKSKGLCMNCMMPLLDDSSQQIDIHHIQPIKFGGPKKFTNLAVLCYECHKEVSRAVSTRDIARVREFESSGILKGVSGLLYRGPRITEGDAGQQKLLIERSRMRRKSLVRFIGSLDGCD